MFNKLGAAFRSALWMAGIVGPWLVIPVLLGLLIFHSWIASVVGAVLGACAFVAFVKKLLG